MFNYVNIDETTSNKVKNSNWNNSGLTKLDRLSHSTIDTDSIILESIEEVGHHVDH